MTWQLALDIAEGTAAVAGTVTGIVALSRWISGRWNAHATMALSPLDFDLLPLWFELDLMSSRPRVVVYVHAVNFTRRRVRLRSANIRTLNAMQTYVNKIPLTDPVLLLPRRATRITFDRDIHDPELTDLRRIAESNSVAVEGSIAVTAEWQAWRTHQFSTLADLVVHGRIRRPHVDANIDK